jgi:hypothetical protein
MVTYSKSMKTKLFVLFFLILLQFGFSQNEKLIEGIVLCDNLPLQGIEIVNIVSEKTAITDIDGKFSILVKVEDMLVFVSKKYDYKRLFIDKEFLDKNNFTILLTRKPEQLEEVMVTKVSFPKIKFDENIASQLNIEKAATNPKPFGVYDGTIENGIGMYINLTSSRKKIHQIEFKELAKTNYPEIFFIDTLKLKPEEVALFLEFCDADPKSKFVLEDTNPLVLMDFLLTKNVEFRKLPALKK